MKHQDILPVKGSPFENCQLNRKKYADVLTSIVSSYSEGFVLAINNKWGTGKTTFVKMWEQQLKDSDFQTIYFNAWENDFEDNALAAIMGELKTITEVADKEDFKNILKKAAVIGKNVIPQLVANFVLKQTGMGDLKEFSENVSKGFIESFENDVDEYAKKKETIKDFRTELENFIKKKTSDKPLVFIVDELDRCRPDYAVSILEQIKHFFSVKGIVFVLSIDKEQLENAVRGVYGTDLINAEEYLRRFIDLEYSIPEPDKNKFCDYLFDYFKFNEFFTNQKREQMNSFKEIMKLLLNNPSISLRQQEKLLAHTRLSLKLFPQNKTFYPTLFFFLNYIRLFKKQMFDEIRDKKYNIDTLQKQYSSIFNNIEENGIYRIIELEACLVYFYNSSKSDHYKDNIMEDTRGHNSDLIVYSKIDPNKNRHFHTYIYDLLRSEDRNVKITEFLDKIDLLEDIKM
jgi:hypothetical protein